MVSITDHPFTNPYDIFLRDGRTFHKSNLGDQDSLKKIEFDLLMAYGLFVNDWFEHPTEPTLVPVFKIHNDEDAETVTHIMQHLIVSQYLNYPKKKPTWDDYNPCPTDEEIRKEHDELELTMFRFPVIVNGNEYMIRYTPLGYWASVIDVESISVSLYLVLDSALRNG